tara:strand:+ start:884 stop:1465 length:582 start_codon:yes stop_codon:yes gene_type:complete
MLKSRKFRKIILKSEVALIEEEEFEDKFNMFGPEFDQDFQQEIAFLKEKEKPKSKDKIEQTIEDEENEIPQKVSYEFLKSLHRELARILHPDLNKGADDNEFKKMQNAYESGNAAILVSMAADYNIEIDFKEEDLDKIEQQIELKNQKIKKGKSSCRWVWCSSDKNNVIRSMIRSSLGIDEEEFQEWLTKNNK